MPRFTYVARKENRQETRGEHPGPSREQVLLYLREKGLRPISLSPVVQHPSSTGKTAWLENATSARSIHIELAMRQLSVMLQSGLTLLMAVRTVIDQAPSRAVRREFRNLQTMIEGGGSLAESMDTRPCFPKNVVALINMGEESGTLDTALERASEAMETRRTNKQAILTALFYPTFTLLFAIGISVYMILAVIPPMKLALEALGRRLPPITQSLVDVGDFFETKGLWVLSGIVIALVCYFAVRMWPPGRMVLDKNTLRIPLIGRVFRTGATAEFSRSLYILLNSGITLVEGLRILGPLHKNHYLQDVVDSARQNVLAGGELAPALTKPTSYTDMMLKMVGVGEESGNLEEILLNSANFHDERLRSLIKQLSTVLEPVIIILVGIIVGYVYMAFFIGLYGAV